MAKSVFESENYQSYLNGLFSQENPPGTRADLARFLSCQTSFISQVLTYRAHFSLEHAIKVSDFLEHSEDERKLFVLLVQIEKAGSQALRDFFKAQIDEIRNRRQIVRERIQVRDQLSQQDQATYYSQWWYAAIHVLSAMPDINTVEDLQARLLIPRKIIEASLDFLISRKLVESKSTGLAIGKGRIHLSATSPWVARHHANWRLKSIDAIERSNTKDLHYTGIIGISKKDAEHIRSLLLSFLEKSEKVVTVSKEDTPYILLLDFFEYC